MADSVPPQLSVAVGGMSVVTAHVASISGKAAMSGMGVTLSSRVKFKVIILSQSFAATPGMVNVAVVVPEV